MGFSKYKDNQSAFTGALAAYALVYWVALQVGVVAHAYFFPWLVKVLSFSHWSLFVFASILFSLWHIAYSEQLEQFLRVRGVSLSFSFSKTFAEFKRAPALEKIFVCGSFIYLLLVGSLVSAMISVYVSKALFAWLMWPLYLVVLSGVLFFWFKSFCAWGHRRAFVRE